MGCFLPIQIIIKTQPIDYQEKGKYWKGEELCGYGRHPVHVYTYGIQPTRRARPNSSLVSFFIGVQSVDSVGRSNSNHQKTLLRFDPRGKSLSSSLFPSELGPGNFRQRGVAINPLPHEVDSISKVFPFSPNRPPFSPLLSVHFPPKGNATRFQIESLALFSLSSSSAILLPFSKVFLPRILLLLGTMHTWKNNRFHHPKLHPLFEFLCSFHDQGSSFPFNNSQIWNSQRNKRGVSLLERIELNFLEVRKEERKREKNITYTLSSRK